MGQRYGIKSLLVWGEEREPQEAEELGQIVCASYLNGALDNLVHWRGGLPANNLVCLPDQSSGNEQAMLIFIHWAKDQPATITYQVVSWFLM